MRKTIFLSFIALALGGVSAWAQDQATDQTVPSTTTTTEAEVTQGALNQEVVGITPQLGFVNYFDTSHVANTRGTAGITVDVNGSGIANHAVGNAGNDLYAGLQSGVLYAHPGSTGSGFFGTSTPSSSTISGNNANAASLLIVPADVKLGWNFGNFRASGHGGGNAVYRSNSQAVAAGGAPNMTTGGSTSFLPNVGADLEFGKLNVVAIDLRPDWTIGGPNRIFTGTIGATFPLG